MKYLGNPQSGSQAATTASRNRFGQYLRTRAIPVQPRTTRQVQNRSLLSTLSQAWRALTAAQQAAWGSWAVDHPSTDSLGQAVVLSGAQAYIGVNMATSTGNLGVVTDPPPFPEPAWDPNIVSGWASVGGTIEATHEVIPADNALVVYASPPRSPGVNFNGQYRFIQVIPAGPSGTTDISAAYSAVFGVPPDGSRIFTRVRQVQNQGWRGPAIDAVLTYAA